MQRTDLFFERPPALQATLPPEARQLQRDEVRLLVTTPQGEIHTHFTQLADFLAPGDLVVVNRSATLPASLPVSSALGDFLFNFSTHYGDGLWLAEPRWSSSEPGPLPLTPGERVVAGQAELRLLAPYPGLPRLWFVHSTADLTRVLCAKGAPIRYGYVQERLPLAAYQTLFAKVPGSAEMPSAARPFTRRVVQRLRRRGIKMAGITLHTGVSSLEIETEQVEAQPMYAEPFQVPAATAQLVNATRQAGHRVIAVGTTVVRALESAWDGSQVRPQQGFTRLFIHPQRGVHVVDGLLTGFHDPLASHLAMLYAIAGRDVIQASYRTAVEHGYLWHEFGDSQLILPN
ncbi:MAG: S-adenosylmethionine:tRNA ribosyltransferase-isomerase [Caldilineaceae bacterium]|nr:S-adenosylmethionine:tRNA ribosyltransferase-isomerase [Caldilineaceae bacterium]